MATFAITSNVNADELTGKTGGDIYNISGFTLTVDQDSRYGLNQSTAASLGNATISAALGGNLNIDARNVREIAYTGGTGNVPAYNTVISQGGASGKLSKVYATRTSAPTAPGAAMPATGFIMVKQVTGTYAAGALTGIGATSGGADVAGWIEIVGDEAAGIIANRLGQVNILGAWYTLGTTSGVANQTLQIPNNGLQRYAAGVFIEKTAGLADYEFWPNAGAGITTTGTDSTRGKCVWIDATGLVRIGNSGAAANGYTPPAGLKVVIGNIFLENCTTAARTANVIPNATLATRYDFTTTGGGVVTVDKANMAWYPSFAQPYSVILTNCGAVDAISLSECATPIAWSKVGVGNKPTTALLVSALTLSLCPEGGTLTDCVWTRVSHAATGAWTNTYTDIAGFTFTNDTMRCSTIRANATTGAALITRAKNCQWLAPNLLQGQLSFVTCSNFSVTGTKYVDCISGTTTTATGQQIWQMATNCTDWTISGLTLPVTNCQPYQALLVVSAAGCSNGKLRNIGTRAVPLSLGTVNTTSLIYQLATGAAASAIKIQRVYCSATRTNIMTADNSSTGILEESVYGDFADAPLMACLNMQRKGGGCTAAVTAQVSVYGSHFQDFFTAATAGRFLILMNEPTAATAAQVTLTGGAAFTSAGGLYMPTINDQAVFETPYYLLGHTSFQNAVGVMAGGTIGNYTVEFALDKNDGAGFGAYQVATGANLSGVTGINPALGFKVRVRLTTTTTNVLVITSLYFLTNSTAVAQNNLYPLDTLTLTLTGIQPGSDVVILQAGTTSILAQADAILGTTYSYVYSVQQAINIRVYKNGLVPFFINNYSLPASDASLPVAQVSDRAFT